jgi:hypothetical protein
MVPITWVMGSYIVPETFKIILGGGVEGACNGHYGNERQLDRRAISVNSGGMGFFRPTRKKVIITLTLTILQMLTLYYAITTFSIGPPTTSPLLLPYVVLNIPSFLLEYLVLFVLSLFPASAW